MLAGSGITNTGATTINGTNHSGDAVTQGAKADLVTAYNAAAGQGPASPIVADLGGTTLVSGVYTSPTSLALTGTLTLDGQGDTSAVWVFQAGSTPAIAVPASEASRWSGRT